MVLVRIADTEVITSCSRFEGSNDTKTLHFAVFGGPFVLRAGFSRSKKRPSCYGLGFATRKQIVASDCAFHTRFVVDSVLRSEFGLAVIDVVILYFGAGL